MEGLDDGDFRQLELVVARRFEHQSASHPDGRGGAAAHANGREFALTFRLVPALDPVCVHGPRVTAVQIRPPLNAVCRLHRGEQECNAEVG